MWVTGVEWAAGLVELVRVRRTRRALGEGTGEAIEYGVIWDAWWWATTCGNLEGCDRPVSLRPAYPRRDFF